MNPFKSDKTLAMLTVLLLTAVTFAVYWRILGHEFLWAWDDKLYVSENEVIRGISWQHIRQVFTSFYAGNYAPLQMLSYMLDYEIWGLAAGGYLFTNIVIHAANGTLLFILCRRWTGDLLAALAATTLFLLHPVQVETVAWISQRKNLLCMFFLLLSWEEYCRYRDPLTERKGLAYAASLSAFALSLLAKSVSVIFPLILLFYDVCFSGYDRRPRWKDKIPFFAAAAVITAVAMYSVDPEYGGSSRTVHGGSRLATFYTMLPVFCQYLGMLVWPTGLSADYAPFIHTSIDAGVIGAALLLAATVFAGILLFRKDRRLGFWILFFWIALLPLSQIVPLASMINDRYLYIPFIGVAVLSGAGIAKLRDRFWPHHRVLFCTLLAPLVLLLAMASHERAGVWRNSMTLFSDAVKKVPNSTKAWDYLVIAYKRYYATPASQSRDLHASDAPPVQLDLVNKYASLGDSEKEYLILQQLLKLYPKNPVGWARLGENRLDNRDFQAAEQAYQKAHSLQPEAMYVVIQLGNLAAIQKRFDLARDYYGKAEAKGWKSPEIAYQLACVESMAGRREASLYWLEKALQRGYRDYNNLVNNEELANISNDPNFDYLLQSFFQAPGRGR